MKKMIKCMKKKQLFLMILFATASLILASCNVTRTVTTSSEYFQKGDTTVVIQTKTVESYNAEKK